LHPTTPHRNFNSFNENGLPGRDSYFGYYHRSRTHLALAKDAPEPRAIMRRGKIVAIPQVGGLHHRYERHAAREPEDIRLTLNRSAVVVKQNSPSWTGCTRPINGRSL
jgi:hypothetical protein